MKLLHACRQEYVGMEVKSVGSSMVTLYILLKMKMIDKVNIEQIFQPRILGPYGP